MGRSSSPLLKIASALLLCSTVGGCASVSSRSLPRWLGGPKAETAATDEAASDDAATGGSEKVAAKDAAAEGKAKDDPFVKPDEAKVTQASATEEKNAPAAEAVATAEASEGQAETATAAPVPETATEKADFSPEVLALIDAELKDASDEERQDWYQQLKKVHPSVVPELLRARRLTLNIRNGESADAAPKTDGAWGHSGGAGTSPPRQDPAGLGSTSPWGGAAASQSGSPSTAATNGADGRERPFRTVAGRPNLPDANSPVTSAVATESPAGQDAVQQVSGEQANMQAPGGSPFASTDPAATAVAPTGEEAGFWGNAARQIADGVRGVAPLPGGNRGTGTTSVFGNLLPGKYGETGGVQSANHIVQSNSQVPTSTQAPVTSGDWQATLEQLISQVEYDVGRQALEADGGVNEEYIRKHVYLRLLYLMSQQQERALTAIPRIDAPDQEFWQQITWAIANYFDTRNIPHPEDRATQTIAQLNAAIRRLQSRGRLELHNVAFCHRIASYGNYETFPRDEFTPGQDVLLYAEVENFQSEITAAGEYRTLLRSAIEVLTPSGEVRKQIEFQATEDLCRNHRRDYFHSYQFTIPPTLPLGPYVLKLSVFDELSGKMVTYSQNFTVK